jgi:hypothetical protein
MKKKLLWILGGGIWVAFSIWFLLFVFNSLLSFCEVESLSSTPSPDGSKKVEVFVVNCGATTDWSTQASILKPNEMITDSSRGNLLAIDGNHGEAWPEAGKGWPVIVPVWNDSNNVEIHYSRGTRATPEDEMIKGVNVTYRTITPEFVEENAIEIRPTMDQINWGQ